MNTNNKKSTVDEINRPKLTEAHQSRLLAQKDAQLLANRIKLLQQEQYKAWKKIQQSKKKAKDVLTMKEQQQEFIAQKEAARNQQQKKIEQQREYYNKIRKQRWQSVNQSKTSFFSSRMENAGRGRHQSLENKKKLKSFNRYMKKVNTVKKQAVKFGKQKGMQMVYQLKQQRDNQSKLNYLSRVEGQEAIRRQKEREVAEMEQLEMELIRKLQNTQMLQKQAAENLEEARRKPIRKSWGESPRLIGSI